MSDRREITVVAPINIAIVKYWGKFPGPEGETNILPVNDSLSVTLSCDLLRTRTQVTASSEFEDDTMILNAAATPLSRRIKRVLALVREHGAPANLKVQIVTDNNFPTAAGMASSAAGLAALAFALTKLFPESTVNPSLLARIGSGSACRSIYGGFVQWISSRVSEEAIAKVVYPETHWPELQVLCLVVGAHQKDVSSTDGMQLSVMTSPLMPERIKSIAPRRIVELTKAIREKDLSAFATIAMLDSDDFHSVCFTSVPTITYLSQGSYRIQNLVRAYNEAKGKTILGYSFDAGPNAFLFTTREHLLEVLGLALTAFPKTEKAKCTWEKPLTYEGALEAAKSLPSSVQSLCAESGGNGDAALSLFFHSSVGSGPKVL
eukprot:PhF_6_TR13880/c0_g1_i1/m.22278/K01597/MVD, mvaD; diphosphomevalonate decarboxylase